jgi:hypothetical protein
MSGLLVILLAAILAADEPGLEGRIGSPVRGAAYPDLESLLADLKLKNVSRQNYAVEALRMHLKRILGGLEIIAMEGAAGRLPETSTEEAMLLLGEMRSKKSVPILVENLKFTKPFRARSRVRLFPDTPQIPALIEIGLPSLDPLVKKVASTDDDLIRQRAAIVIDQILGTDMAVFFVQDRVEREKDAAKKERLKRLAEQIDTTERNRKGKVNLGALRPPPVIARPSPRRL